MAAPAAGGAFLTDLASLLPGTSVLQYHTRYRSTASTIDIGIVGVQL